ncbi:substrate-binding domain-containing protein [Nakamurella sp. YIM 132087]|uniref:Substrate-binding domain-containing protein n=1 Tax=Nakamurella alba TaxID=2665158 RepID=A0A7K1FTH5_9ACTN|nr:LacI family DNA-binding transcriptional regulator [Nakamurella alba]MTD17467.1 substrate-binding domain-containing protein [Nakamurella alba]
MSAGNTLPSIADVAALAGVSTGTVSNVLNRPHVVAAPTRERVDAAIASLGFVRNESARVLGSGSSRALGFVAMDVGNPFFTDIARAVQDVAEASGLVVLLADSRESVEQERANVELFAQQRVRGVVITPAGDVTGALEMLARTGIPAVLVDPAAGGADHCSVATDDLTGGRLAVRHLLDLGHRRVAFVGGPARLHQVADRFRGAAEEVADTAGAVLQRWDTDHLTIAAGRRAGADLLAKPIADRPTGIFAANDLLALGILHELLAAGCAVPGDVAVIGYDDIDLAATGLLPLSTVRQPRAEMGRQAAGLLLEEIGGDPRHRHRQLLFTPEVIVRASTTGTPATATMAPGGVTVAGPPGASGPVAGAGR